MNRLLLTLLSIGQVMWQRDATSPELVRFDAQNTYELAELAESSPIVVSMLERQKTKV